MDIRCTTCGKDVTPLELYDGSWSCPICRKPLSDFQSDFVITADNEELFVQSELLFANWLFNHDGRARFSTVKRAVDLCRQSARMGNPKAIARLAFYYDKNYTEKSYGDVMRCKIAYTYYSAICYSSVRTVKVEKGLPPVSWDELYQKTAYSMLYMLATAPAELQETKVYSLHNNLERVRHEMGLEVDLSAFEKTDDHISFNERVFSVMRSCLDKNRAPLFGAFRLKASDMQELYSRPMPGKEDKIPQALYWLTTSKKVLWAYIRANALKDTDKKFSRLSTKRSVDAFFDETQDNEYVWVFFFNHNGGHKYLSSQKKREKVEKTIYGRVGTDLLKTLLQNGNQRFYTFYDDDIYQYMKQTNETEATKMLIDVVCKGGDEV